MMPWCPGSGMMKVCNPRAFSCWVDRVFPKLYTTAVFRMHVVPTLRLSQFLKWKFYGQVLLSEAIPLYSSRFSVVERIAFVSHNNG